jgi:hypothetical protein
MSSSFLEPGWPIQPSLLVVLFKLLPINLILALKMEAVFPSETASTFKSTQRYNPEEQHRHLHLRENIKTYIANCVTDPTITTERVCIEITLFTCSMEVAGSNLGYSDEICYGSLLCLQAKAGMIAFQTYHDRLLQNPYLLIIHDILSLQLKLCNFFT